MKILSSPAKIITEVIVPAPSAGTRSHYLEAREKQSFDWPLVSVAIVLDPRREDGPRCARRDGRSGAGAVAITRSRSRAQGRPARRITRRRAAAEATLKDAKPMSDNAYKVVIAKVIVRRAIMHAAGPEAV